MRLRLASVFLVVGISACRLLSEDNSDDNRGDPLQSAQVANQCVEGETRGCYSGAPATEGIGICHGGTQTCTANTWGPCQGEQLPVPERCDNLDNDCNGIFDDGCNCRPEETQGCYTGTGATEGVGICSAGTRTCVNGRWSKICFGTRTPTAEQCDRIDNDCNGLIDDGLNCQCTNGQTRSCFTGPAGADTRPPCQRGTQTCASGAWGACTGEVLPRVEACNGVDDNCDGAVDNGAPCPGGYFCSGGTCQPIPSSCPYVYAWNGKEFVYETSVGGSGLIGSPTDLSLGRSIDFRPMLARLGHGAVDRLRHAKARLLIAEDEIGYVDQARLTVVEHPAGHEVFTSTSMQWSDRPDPQELYAFRSAGLRAPLAASWMDRRDVTREIGSLDERAVAYDAAVENWYALDFGAVKDARRARLVIDGWKYKEPRGLPPGTPRVAPHVEVQQKDGSWKTAARFSYPRGDNKAVVVDLGGVEWPEGRYRMRFVTGTNEEGLALWYVDRVRLTEEASAPVRVTELEAASATLAWRGVPSYVDQTDRGHPRWNRDDGKGDVDPAVPDGMFTRYGDVKALLAAPDDIMVVMRQGDAITFDFAGVPRPAAGRTQTLFLRTELLFKSRICSGCTEPSPLSSSVLPLPFHGMTRYPYGAAERFPDDEAHRAWLAELQTRPGKPGTPTP